MDKLYAQFADEFEREYVSQGYNANRDIEETLEIGWKLLSILPRSELKRIKDAFLDEYYDKAKAQRERERNPLRCLTEGGDIFGGNPCKPDANGIDAPEEKTCDCHTGAQASEG